MKQLFRSIVLILFVGGWALASAAVHVVRTPSSKVPILLTKDRLGYKDTYVDTRTWTVTEDAAHPALVARLIHLGRADVLAHTTSANSGPVEAQLAAAVAHPSDAPASSHDNDLASKAKAELKTVTDAVKSKIN